MQLINTFFTVAGALLASGGSTEHNVAKQHSWP